MKYLRFVFPVVLVVLLGYLYSCSIDNPTKPVSSVSQEVLGDSPNGECPDLEGYAMGHMCLDFKNIQGDIITSSVTNAEVWVSGKDDNGIELYTCHYTCYFKPRTNDEGYELGNGKGYTLGSRLPVGLHITRNANVTINGGPWRGTQTFIMPSNIYYDPSYYMILYTIK